MKKQFITLGLLTAAFLLTWCGETIAQQKPDVIIKSGTNKDGKNVISDSLLQAMRESKKKPRLFEIGASYGLWFLANSSKYYEEGSLVDLQSCRDVFGARFSYAPYNDVTISSLVNFMIALTPKSVHLSNAGDSLSVNASGKGGVILLCFIGAKYYFSKKIFRPYVGLYPGYVYAYVKGGTATGGLSSISKDIEKQKGSAFALRAEGGVNYMLSEAAMLGGDIAYIRSGDFNGPVGGLQNFRGWNFTLSLSYLF